ncbi:RimK family alpha-L-glutamate ligase [Aureimonas altamirensis]|uniref:ATP-grasp domain-containing protein n=1 Tax=Aureimonas altamirensis TaxID=370622 RepID=UPI00203713AC|nr:RimK family alpha-L-glutamate ligase [Aureimonas altamirensis]MCM2502224.1 RimK family alpha-L-glutamate ligase [Aureimonas altamirensis]
MRIALLSAAPDRHARQLEEAFAALGCDCHRFETAEIGFDTGAAHGIVMPRLGEALPDAVCLRTMAGGSFEAVTRRLGVLHALSAQGIVVSNDARAVERCTDKSMTSFLLARAGLPTPRSHAVETRAQALAILAAAPGPLVLKPLFGAQGKGIRLVETPDDLPEPGDVGGVYYLQEFIGHRRAGAWCDYRILVSRGVAVGAMMRRSPASWITNVAQGAEAVGIAPDPELERLAIAAADAVGAHFCGVDLMRDAHGAAQVIEVNSMPAWTGLEQATGIDFAAIRARDLVAELRAEGRHRVRTAR